MTGAEIGRLKKATKTVITGWMIAAFDGESLHVIPEDVNAARVTEPASDEIVSKRSDAAKRAWETIRANRAKGSVKA